MKRILSIIFVGLGAGLVDLIPLVMAKVPLFNMMAIMVFWLVTVIFMDRTTFVKNSILNGLVIAVLLMFPLVLTVSAVNPKDFLPMLSMAVILGPVAGWLVGIIKNRL